ncbi:hypothetical protein Celaphus_00019326 [Cervus elaphus hippelaphus]|uniref:Adhesion G protein-coupled receptor A2 n=1 Tax=Cervus elaphus hippelaphus TaxID=46360 RepID=A0A212C2I7_CEREH|nr:hypothetical protein Celaphus_00019326 [Cervus elaphus hippelaphus]
MAAGHRRAHARGVCLLQPQSLPGAPSPPREPREPLCSTLGPSTLCRDFGTEFLTCDCRLRWLLPWARNRSLQLSERTLCAYPSALHAQALAGLQEVQLRCVSLPVSLPTEGALELHTHHLIPSLRQVVFQGDRLPFQCSASYLGNDTRIRWYHNRAPVEGDEQAGVLLADSLVHDCTFITSELTLSHIGVWASGEWECSVSTAQGNASKKVEIVVLETSASYCPAERVANNRGDFRWPRTLAGITAYQSCLQYPFTSVPLSGGAPGTRASRRCDRAGRWEPGDYSHCLYTNDITRVLYTFVLGIQIPQGHTWDVWATPSIFVPQYSKMPINASNALTLAHQLRVYTAEAASFSDMMDVVYVAQMIQKFLGYVDQIKELVEVMVDMASNLMLVDEHLLWLAQREDKACSGIVGALERIGGAALSPHAQHISVNSRNVALEAYLIKPHSYVGLTCTAFQRREMGGCGVGNLTEPVAISLRHWAEGAEPVAAWWSQEGPGGPGGWRSEGCQLRSSQPNVSSLHCQHLGNVAVLMILSRFYLIAGGIPLIICGITAAVNIHNYRDHGPYCWLVWRPSLGAFYIPVALILLITWIYFLCAGLRLRGPLAQGPKAGTGRVSLEPGEELRGSTRLRSSGPLLSDSGSLLAAGSTGVVTPGPPEDGDGLYSPGVQLGALVTTHFLYLATWACGALTVSQRWLPRVVCSCLYGVAASALGLFVFTHHCARRRDVRASWRACRPSASAPRASPRAAPTGPEDGSPRRSASRDNLRGGALEKESKRRSYPLNSASLNGAPKGGKYEDVPSSGAEAAGGGCMKTGLWKSETTV